MWCCATYRVQIAPGVKPGELDHNGSGDSHGLLDLEVHHLALAQLTIGLEDLPGNVEGDLFTVAAVNQEGAWLSRGVSMKLSGHEEGARHVRLALTISVRQGRPRIMMPLPLSTATLASASFWFIVRSVARHDDQGPTHGVLGESIRHAGGAALHLATDLDEHRAELAKLAGDGRLEGAIILGLGKAVGFNRQTCSWLAMKTITYFAMKTQALEG